MFNNFIRVKRVNIGLLGLFLVGFWPLTVKASDTPTLSWELVNPFKFIQDGPSFDEIRREYEKLLPLKERTPQNLERKLQDIADAAVDNERKKITGCRADPPDERQACINRVRTPYLGYFAGVAENDHQKTCWDSARQEFRDAGHCKDYIFPVSHRIRVWVNDPHLLNGMSPDWDFDGQPIQNLRDCHSRYQKAICIEVDIDYDENIGHKIRARFPDGTTAETPVKVIDRLIVGLGDSFASGEGNPDIPAQFFHGEFDSDFILEPGMKRNKAPSKNKDTKVGWLDWRCHRSMYSYQFKTALHMALKNPQQAVTYVSYACSGAVTDEIINRTQEPVEGFGRIAIQLETLRKALTVGKKDPRKIDYLLVSTGGNDLGFSKFVAFIVTQGWQRKLAAGGVTERTLGDARVKIKETLLGSNTGKYRRLHAALTKDECPTEKQPDKKCSDLGQTNRKGSKKGVASANRIPLEIKTCTEGKPCARILLTPYPDMLHETPGNLCTASKGEFDISFGPSKERVERIKLINDYIFRQLRTTQLQIPAELGWTVVQSQFDAFNGHGFCAQNLESSSKTAEKFNVPLLRKDGTWSSFDPWDYRAYERRERWFRLPVDAKLTTDQLRVILGKIWIDWKKTDDRSNIMHPTAEAHAVTALANYEEIQRLDALNPP